MVGQKAALTRTLTRMLTRTLTRTPSPDPSLDRRRALSTGMTRILTRMLTRISTSNARRRHGLVICDGLGMPWSGHAMVWSCLGRALMTRMLT